MTIGQCVNQINDEATEAIALIHMGNLADRVESIKDRDALGRKRGAR